MESNGKVFIETAKSVASDSDPIHSDFPERDGEAVLLRIRNFHCVFECENNSDFFK